MLQYQEPRSSLFLPQQKHLVPVNEASASASLGAHVSVMKFYHVPNLLSSLIRHVDRLGQAKGYWDIPYLDGKVMLDFYICFQLSGSFYSALVLHTEERYIVEK